MLSSIAVLFAAFAAAAAQRNTCLDAAQRCDFRFANSLNAVPTFDVTGTPDVTFTPRLVWRDAAVHAGIVNSNLEGAIVSGAGDVVPFANYTTGAHRFSKSQFKPFTIARRVPGNDTLVPTPYSGIGHETFQGNVAAANGLCVLVRITQYQVLDDSTPPNVIRNVGDARDCVVFRARA